MSIVQVVVTAGGIVLSGLILWWFFGAPKVGKKEAPHGH